MHQLHLLKQFLQLSSNCVANLGSGGSARNVSSAHTGFNDVSDSLLNDLGLLEQAERVLEHQSDGEDSGNWVDDALASDIGGGALDSN